MTYACLTCVLIFVLLVLLECPAILVSAGQAGQKSGQTGHLVTLFRGVESQPPAYCIQLFSPIEYSYFVK